MDHNHEFMISLTKTFQENIWREELQVSEVDELLGSKRTELASIDLKLERKEFKSAAEERKAQDQAKSEEEGETIDN